MPTAPALTTPKPIELAYREGDDAARSSAEKTVRDAADQCLKDGTWPDGSTYEVNHISLGNEQAQVYALVVTPEDTARARQPHAFEADLTNPDSCGLLACNRGKDHPVHRGAPTPQEVAASLDSPRRRSKRDEDAQQRAKKQGAPVLPQPSPFAQVLLIGDLARGFDVLVDGKPLPVAGCEVKRTGQDALVTLTIPLAWVNYRLKGNAAPVPTVPPPPAAAATKESPKA